MAATQEVDVVMLGLCIHLADGKTCYGIIQCVPVIVERISGVIDEEIRIPRYGVSSMPRGDWSSSAAPLWWTANNKIKHMRDEHFNKATLKNGYNSVRALLVTIAYHFYAEMTMKNRSAKWGTSQMCCMLVRICSDWTK